MITHFEPWHVLAFGRQVMLELCFRYTRLSHNFLPRTYDRIWAASGSNGWAIAPSKTASGHAMLFVNPHLPWFGFSQMYEAQLRSDEGLELHRRHDVRQLRAHAGPQRVSGLDAHHQRAGHRRRVARDL